MQQHVQALQPGDYHDHTEPEATSFGRSLSCIVFVAGRYITYDYTTAKRRRSAFNQHATILCSNRRVYDFANGGIPAAAAVTSLAHHT